MESVSIANLLRATGGVVQNNVDKDAQFRAISTDSRTLKAGELFWAIRGANHDGHDHLKSAIDAGAAGVVIDQELKVNVPVPTVRVNHTLDSLGDFANWYRSQMDLLVLGVTGSVGKSTTRHMIHSVLSAGFSGLESPKNFNNEIGVPLSILGMESSHEFAVLELAASAIGDIEMLADIAEPEFGVITNIGPAHVETFGSLENIVQTKGELAESLPSNGLLVLFGDDPYCENFKRRATCRIVTVGCHDSNDFQARDIQQTPQGISFRIDNERIFVPAFGKHHVPSALAAIALALEIGMDAESIRNGFSSYVPMDGRSRVERIGDWLVIDDSYNASPLSMAAACQTLAGMESIGPRIAVMGDMLELGEQASEYHRQLGQQVAESSVDYLLCYGEFSEDIAEGAYAAGLPAGRIATFNSINSLCAILGCWLEPGSVITVKGSRGMAMERVVEWMKIQAETWSQNAMAPLKQCA